MPAASKGFWVAITMKGSGRGKVSPSMLTCRSSIDSRRADCAFGDALFSSSASSTLEKTGPGRKTGWPWSRSKIIAPVTSDGSRSAVNCTRRNSRPNDLASAFAKSRLSYSGKILYE